MSLALYGQNKPVPGMNYQAVAFDANGKIMANTPIKITFAFTDQPGSSQPFYIESYQILTNDAGMFNLVIGEGVERSGDITRIPWSDKKIWLDVEISSSGFHAVHTKYSTQLQAVPYAFHAQKAGQLVESEQPTEKSQSIRWTTTGNTATSPETHFLGTRDAEDLVIKTNLQTRATLTEEGQLQISGGVSGVDSSPNSYPILIEGSKQGIYIKVNGSRSYDNNFVNFADDEGSWGTVEGQTFAELEEWWEYRFNAAVFALNGAALVASAIAIGIEAAGLYAAGTGAAASLIFAFAAPGFYGAAVAATAAGIVVAIESASLLAQSIEFGIKSRELIGVSYSSGFGDYAEWIERNPKERDLQFGEIVGIKGGKASLNTADADHIMIISTRPIVLGNAPQPEKEENFEKVAFLGQAPVRVSGKVAVGDYILASGRNDGIGIAVHPSQVKIGDYKRIVGVAWEAAKENAINLINIGIGLNKHDLAPKVETISQKIDNIVAYLEGKAPLHPQEHSTLALAPATQTGATNPPVAGFSNEEFDQLIEDKAEYLKKFYRDLEQQLQAQGTVLPEVPELQALFKDPVKTLKKMRRDPAYQNQWKLIDQKIKADR
jgi:hypothetical protein